MTSGLGAPPLSARVRRAAPALFLAVLTAVCGGVAPSPAPSPNATPLPPGLLHGSYVLHVRPAPECSTPSGVFSFLVDASTDVSSRYPGVQAVDARPAPTLELELLDGGARVRGAVGTAGGVTSAEGVSVWMRLLAGGDVTLSSNGSAEILAGTAFGDLEFGADEDDEGGLGSCTSTAHVWSLRKR